MSMRATLIAVLAASCASAQQTGSPGGARELYYLSISAKDPLPPVRQNAPQADPRKSTAMHLGLRYNLELQNSAGKAEPIPSDRVLKAGDCFSIVLEANRSGYLYVLAKQSSGAWMPLLPSPEMADESNVLDPGKKVRVPRSYCFEIHDPPGIETLFVVLSRNPRDFYELYEGIKGKASPAQPEPAAPKHPEGTLQMADARLVNDAVAQMNERFGTRDLAIKKVSEPLSANEAKGSVYVVNSSSKPASSIVTQIQIRHR